MFQVVKKLLMNVESLSDLIRYSKFLLNTLSMLPSKPFVALLFMVPLDCIFIRWPSQAF